MVRYRLRIVLLSLGVLGGYGSAFARLHQHHHDRDDHCGRCHHADAME